MLPHGVAPGQLRPRRGADRGLDPGRLGGGGHDGLGSAGQPDRGACSQGSRIHLDDTPVPVLAKGKTRTGRLWTAVRDDRPFGGPDPPAAAYFYSADRSGSHAEIWLADYAGIVQADAFSGFGRLYEPGRKQSSIIEAGCWAHARRKFFELAELQKAPIAIEAVARIDAVFAVEREINGRAPGERQAVRQDRSRALVVSLEAWLRATQVKLSPKARRRWPLTTC
jgi:transposase